MDALTRLFLPFAILLATVGVYFLAGAPWARAIGYDFAGPARPLLGAAILGAAVLVLLAEARAARRAAAHGEGTSTAAVGVRSMASVDTMTSMAPSGPVRSDVPNVSHRSNPSKPSKASGSDVTAGRTVVLYTREHCSLCDEARAVLAKVAAETGHTVWEEDVDRDPALAARYGDRVPVGVLLGPGVVAGGEQSEELFELAADVARLRARLARSA